MFYSQRVRQTVFAILFSSAILMAPPAEARTKRRIVTKKKTAPRKAVRKVVPKKVAPRAVVKRSNAPISVEEYRDQSRQRAIELVKQAAESFERGDYQTTVELCKIANDNYPTYSRAYTWMGAGYQKLGDKDKACSAFKWVIALSPNTPDAERAQRGLREMGYYNPSF